MPAVSRSRWSATASTSSAAPMATANASTYRLQQPLAASPVRHAGRENHRQPPVFDPTTGRKKAWPVSPRSIDRIPPIAAPANHAIDRNNVAPPVGPQYPYYRARRRPHDLARRVACSNISPAARRQYARGRYDESRPALHRQRQKKTIRRPQNILAQPFNTGPRRVARAPAWLLDLGKVARTAEIGLNGKHIATLIGPEYPPSRFPATFLKEGKNTLRSDRRRGNGQQDHRSGP